MKTQRFVRAAATARVVVAAGTLAAGTIASGASAALADVECSTPAPQHCGEACAPEAFASRGNAIEPETGREFFLDYPCDLAWMPDSDDAYLRNIVNLVLERFGRDNIGAFWLAGHSQGGMTSNRLVCTEYFRDKVDGWLSLSGGRIGRAEVAPDFFGADGPPAALASSDANAPRPGAAVMPDCDISFVFTSGQREIVELPSASPIADRYRCGARERRADIVDSSKGYVTGQAPGRGASWGREARPGTAEVYVYPGCAGGKLVVDVLRIDKGHTEGLEPRVTEALIAMMASAPGGKLAGRSAR